MRYQEKHKVNEFKGAGGYIPCKSFSLGSSKAQADADHVREAPGYEGEWVTLVALNVYGDIVRYKRRDRPIFATRQQAIEWAQSH